MTTLDDLTAREKALSAALDAPRRAARSLIASKVADTASHAGRGLTAALIDTPDGRSTVARARRGRSFAAAVARLRELADALASLIADWREESYREGFAWWADRVPDGMARPGEIGPTIVGVSEARGMVLHGESVYSEVTHAADEAARRLLTTVARAARKGLPAADARDLIDGWESRTVATLTAAVDRMLSDSQVAADQLAMRGTVRPELLEA